MRESQDGERERMGLSVGVLEKTRLTEEAGLAAVIVDRAGAVPKEKRERDQEKERT